MIHKFGARNIFYFKGDKSFGMETLSIPNFIFLNRKLYLKLRSFVCVPTKTYPEQIGSNIRLRFPGNSFDPKLSFY